MPVGRNRALRPVRMIHALTWFPREFIVFSFRCQAFPQYLAPWEFVAAFDFSFFFFLYLLVCARTFIVVVRQTGFEMSQTKMYEMAMETAGVTLPRKVRKTSETWIVGKVCRRFAWGGGGVTKRRRAVNL